MHPLQRFIARSAWLVWVFVWGLLLGAFVGPVSAQGPEPSSPHLALGTGFTYQGHLQKNGTPVNGACSLTFSLWDSQGVGPVRRLRPDMDTIDAGGGTSTGGAYALTSSIGQPDAGAQLSATYTLGGGFWAVPGNLAKLFLPLIRR